MYEKTSPDGQNYIDWLNKRTEYHKRIADGRAVAKYFLCRSCGAHFEEDYGCIECGRAALILTCNYILYFEEYYKEWLLDKVNSLCDNCPSKFVCWSR